ncbi:MAG: hypothetical protein HQK91_05190 [Nitrospirae bacterium]|nr:hypothetical protein [Nitrospirota bacterium]
METIISNPVISEINNMLQGLSEETLIEINHYVSFMTEKERKHKAFVEETLKIEAESDTVTFNSVDEAMDAIRNWKE